jgi:release factor glutamine methyltransferase
MNVEQALRAARQLGLERLDATRLLAHHMRCSREWLLAHAEASLDSTIAGAFDIDCRRRAEGVPLAYLTGWREFRGLALQVTPAVLVPRPETELLAEWAIEVLHGIQASERKPRVVDLGTGSGALALAIASACPNAHLTATDCSVEALAVAGANARRLDLPIRFAQGDWWRAVGNERFELAVSNPPYVAPGDPHLSALRHEPMEALVASEAGLEALRQIVEQARPHVTGWLLLEHGWDQAEAVQMMLMHSGFREVATRTDLQGHPRCTGGRAA